MKIRLMLALSAVGLSLPPHISPGQTPTPAAPTTAAADPDTPNPDAAGIYRVRDGVSAPKMLHMVQPEFTEKARKKRITGDCTVAVVVDTDGHVKDIRVVRSIAEGQPPKLQSAAASLDAQAVIAARQYRFSPALHNGKPVPVEIQVDVNFQIF